MRLYFATGNQYKFDELRTYLGVRLPEIELRQLAIMIPEIQASDPIAIIRAKLEYVTNKTNESFIVDDASFDTIRHPGFPGAYAKFINSTLGYEGWRKLFEDGDPITAKAMIGLHHCGEIMIFKGEIEGRFSFKANGEVQNHNAPLNDIIFIPSMGSSLSDAMKRETFKNHRIHAVDQLANYLANTVRSSDT